MTVKRRKQSKKKTLKAYGYVRVSTKEQVEEGLSIEAQKEKIIGFAKLHDLELVEIVVDEGYSGKDLERPGIQNLLSKIDNEEAEGIIVYKLDRLSRRTRDLLMLIEETFTEGNTRFFSISERIDTSTAMGKFFLTLMAGLAQMERELISERTRAVLDMKRKNGEYLGQVPFGYKLEGKKLVQNDEEYRVIRRMKRWKREGKSYREIARLLNKNKIPPKKGGIKWYHTSVRSILI